MNTLKLTCNAALLALLAPFALGAAKPAVLAAPTDADFARMGIADIRRGVVSDAPATDWERALVTGNGLTGAMAMGAVGKETIVLNRAGLFLPYTPPMPPINQGAHLPEIRRLIAEGRYQAAADFAYELSQKEGYHGTHWTEPFVPVCSLQVRTPVQGEARDYLRGTDYPTGVTSTQYRDAAGTLVRRLFVSRADDVAVLSLRRDDGAPVDVELGFVQHDPAVTPQEKTADAKAFRSVDTEAGADGTLVFLSTFAHAWKGSAQGCSAAARVVAPGGTVVAKEGRLHVSGAREVLVLMRTDVTFDLSRIEPAKPGMVRRELERLTPELAALPANYDALLERHARLHGELFNRMRLDLAGSSAAEHRLPAPALFARSTPEKVNPTLLEKQFDACRYLILSSSSHRFPPTLQGVWGASWHPAWSGDYTHDGNVPVAIIGNLPGNMPELLEGFFSYHESLMDAYRENARRMFNARGIVVPARTGSHGYANHFGPKWCLTFWTAGGAWVAQTYYDYYLHTGDRTFLKRRAIPFMREVAFFYEDFLAGTEGPDGKVVFSPSYSPENNPGNSESQATLNATMDVAGASELLTNLIAACRQEGVNLESVARWERLLGKLPEYRINKDGALAEWCTPLLEDNHAHRHVSHFIELYSGLPAHIEGNPRLIEAFKVALRRRTDWRRSIGGGEMAFGQAQMGAVAANLRLPELAMENVGMLSSWFWFPESLMTAHNPQSIFNTDIAGGIPQLLIRMLCDAQPGRVTLLPALPSQWPAGRLQGALLRGSVELRELEWAPGRVRATLLSPVAQRVSVRVHGVSEERILELRAGEPASVELAR